MDAILEGLLANNLVELEYLSVGKFPTRGLMTKNLHFMYHEDSVEFDEGDFFQAYDILRKRKLTLLNEEDITKISVHNPHSTNPLNLCRGVCPQDEDCRNSALKKFKKTMSPVTERGDMLLLDKASKLLLIAFFAGIDCSDMSSEEIDNIIEDLRYMPFKYRKADAVSYGFFFGCDVEFKSEAEALRYAGGRWLDLIGVYAKLYEQDLGESPAVIKAIREMKMPKVESFKDYDQIIEFWPYVLAPRPVEITPLNIL